MSNSILFFGATGFVGGHVLHKLLSEGGAKDISTIIIPTSSTSKQKKVQRWIDGLNTHVQTSLPIIPREPVDQWYSECRRLSSQVDGVVQLATSDDLQLTKSINEGLITGRESGRKGFLIHASGVQLIESAPIGEYVETPNYDDSDPSSIASIPDNAAHRSIDLEIEHQIHKGAISGAIVCPALVWGKGAGPDKVMSVMIPDTVKKSIHNRRGTYTGSGTNRWVHVHVDECSNLIVALIKKHLASLPSASDRPALFSNFYFASHPDLITFKEIAEVVGSTLHKEGKIDSAEPISVPVPPYDSSMKGVRIEDDSRSQADAEVDARTPLWPCRTNCRCQAKRADLEFGWKATRNLDHDALRQDVLVALEMV